MFALRATGIFIADNLDIPFTTEEMNRYIRAHHTEHPDFAKKIPSSFKRLVDYDRTQAAVVPSSLSRRSLGEGGAYTRPILLPSIPFAPPQKTAYTRLCDTLLS